MNNIMLTIEPLESRIAPAVFTVTSLADPTESGKVTLRDALAMADSPSHPGADTIVFHLPAPPPHGENMITLGSTLTSTGNVTITGPSPGTLIINGGGSFQVFDFNSTASTDAPVKISGLSILNGSNSGSTGGGIYSDVSLTLTNVVISGCTAKNGGGVTVEGTATVHPKVSISNSLITGNTATQFGGGIDLFGGIKSLSISNSGLVGNSATESGGAGFAAIDTEGTGISVSNSIISGNTAGDAGGLFLENSATAAKAITAITGTVISGNSSSYVGPYGGGGLYLGAGKTVITGSMIEQNTAVYNGGGVYASSSFTSLTISKSIISGNQTTASNSRYQGGGGVFINGTTSTVAQSVQISGTEFSANHSATYGGGLFIYNGAGGMAVTISSANFLGNSAPQGGGITAIGQISPAFNIKINGGSFSGNIGQAMNLKYGTDIVTGSKLTGNLARFGAGIYAAGSSLTVKNVSAANNEAYTGGGALFIKSTSNFTVSGGSLTGNQAATGGGIYSYNASGTIHGVTISGNAATTSAGGVFNGGTSGGVVTVQAAKVTGNLAPANPDFATAGTGSFIYT